MKGLSFTRLFNSLFWPIPALYACVTTNLGPFFVVLAGAFTGYMMADLLAANFVWIAMGLAYVIGFAHAYLYSGKAEAPANGNLSLMLVAAGFLVGLVLNFFFIV